MRRVLVFVGLWASLGAPLFAETPVTDVVPADAMLVLRINSPKTVLNRINGYLQFKQFPEGTNPLLDQMLPKEIKETLATTQSVSLVLFPQVKSPKGEKKDVVAILAITDNEAEFKKQFLKLSGVKEKAIFFRSGDYVVACKAELGEIVQQALREKKSSLTQRLSPEDRALFLKGDVAAYFDMPSYVPDSVRQSLPKEIKNLKESALANGPTDSLGPLAALGGVILTSFERTEVNVLQAMVDAEQSVAIVKLDDNGILFDGVMRFTKDSISAKSMQANPPGPMEAIRRFPGKHQVAAQFHGNTKLLFQESLQLLPEIKADSPGPLKRWRDTLKELSDLKIDSLAVSFGLSEPERGAIEVRMLVDVKQPQHLEAWWRRLCEDHEDLGFPHQSLVTRLNVARQPEQHNDRQVTVSKMEIAPKPRGFFELRDPGGENALRSADPFLSVICGPQGLHFRSVGLTDRWLLTIGGSKLEMADAIRRADKSGVGVTDAVNQTVTQLWPEANLMVLFDYPNLERRALVLYEKFAPGLGAALGLQQAAAPGNPSYLGWALRTEPQAIRGRIYVPTTQIEEIKKGSLYLNLLMQGFNMAVKVEAQAVEEPQPAKKKE